MSDFRPTDRETDLAQWSAVLAVDMAADALLAAYTEVEKKLSETPWWCWRERRELRRRSDIYVMLYWAVATKAQEEDRLR
jgi:hypothetical protein